eukprot:jgi/Hompol1/6285/HPOL_002623-RA
MEGGESADTQSRLDKATTAASTSRRSKKGNAPKIPLGGDAPESPAESILPLRKQPHVHMPDVLIVLDYVNNMWAVHEANIARIPVIAICDTNTDPSRVQYPIPANDDSIAGIKLIAGVLSQAAKRGNETRILELNDKSRKSAKKY